MSYKPSGPYSKEFTTSNPSTGAAANADGLPAATANKNGADDGAFTLTVANIDTGRYKITGTIPSGYASGDVLNVSVAATVAGVAGKAIVDTQVIDSKRLSDLNDAAALTDYQQRSVAVTLPTNPPTDWLNAAAVKADAVTKIQAGLSTYAGGDTSGTTTLLARLTSPRAALLDNLDAAVSTRSTYAGGDTSGTTTLLARLSATRAGYLDNLSGGAVALASQVPPEFTSATFASAGVFSTGALANAPTGGSAPTVAQIRVEMDSNSTRLANLDATVSSRSTYAGGAVAGVTAPVTVDAAQAIPTSNGPNTLGDCLNAARAQGFGRWAKSGTALTLYAPDGTTVVRTFTLDDAAAPTSRS